MEVRSARAEKIDRLAELWYRGWQDAHAGIVPDELARRRTLERFRGRMEAALGEVRVIGAPGAPTGFHLLQESRLETPEGIFPLQVWRYEKTLATRRLIMQR